MKRILLCICVMFCAASLAAQTGIEEVEALIANRSEQASEAVGELLKGKNKKNVELVTAVVRAYFDAGQTGEAQAYLELAKRADAKSPAVSLLEGDMALLQKEIGRACQLYEQAIYFDPNCREAYLKYAQAYRSVSPALAVEKLEQLKRIAPDCVEADKALAEIHYAANRFGKAAEHYALFIDTPAATEDDLLKYAFALFLNHDFEQSLAVARKGLQGNVRHAAFNRLVMYNCVDLKRYDEAEQAADAFFNASDDADFSYLDHRYHAALLEQKGDYPAAVTAFRSYYDLLEPEKQTVEELFRLGRLCYAEGTSADSLSVSPDERTAALLLADSVFAQVALQAPDSHLGALWRARTHAALDPETTEGLAKPYYEQVVAVLGGKNDPRYNAALVECYSYLGYYHLLQEEYAASRDCWEKILTLDPENATAHKALESLR